ncbi:MAG: acyl carrier protein [Firmicutes bacterium]|jgi:acyl carrier protein|nr:acyl carrier protein [Bacillota bacterium]MBQ2095003.1 acyl carrier protein [Bacillota bacterium]
MTRQELYEKTVKIIRDCVPELADMEITEDSVVNTDMGMDSMNFILVICKLEAEFGVKIPNRLWKKLSTLGDVLDALQKYGA